MVDGMMDEWREGEGEGGGWVMITNGVMMATPPSVEIND